MGDAMKQAPVVLIAEDDPTIADLVAFIVQQAGAVPVVAYDGRQALEMARFCPPTMVITDLTMPTMKGDALIAALREEWDAALPVILMSASPISLSSAAGANAVLRKPFALAELRALLDRYLAKAASDPPTKALHLRRDTPWRQYGSGAVRAGQAVWSSKDQETQQPILVVEDNLELLEVLGMLLHYEHYQVALTADGQDALNWLALQPPALVILDWLLPTVGGNGVLAASRARYGSHVPIVVLSALADTTEALQAGADAYLRKPYLIKDLVGTIHRLLAA